MKDQIRQGVLWFAVLLIGAILLAGCSSGSARPPANTSEVPRISAQDLKSKIDAGKDVVIVDTRSANTYAAQHIAGAISVPYEETSSRLNEFPKDKEIVFY
jgi:outer membrane murein-binding lipoprotein Lpp